MSEEGSRQAPMAKEMVPPQMARRWRKPLRALAFCLLCLVFGFELRRVWSRRDSGSVTITYGGLTNGATVATFIVHVPHGLEVHANGGLLLRTTNGIWGSPNFEDPAYYASDFGATSYPYKADFLLNVRVPRDGVAWRIAYFCEATPPFGRVDRLRLRLAQSLINRGMMRAGEVVSPYKPKWVLGPEMR